MVVPTLAPVASPCKPAELLIVATLIDEEDHDTDVVMFAVDPSVYRPVAVNCCVPPMETDGLSGLTSMAARTTVVTVRLAEPVTAPEVAVMIVVPLPMLVANPLLPDVLLTVATPGTEELQ